MDAEEISAMLLEGICRIFGGSLSNKLARFRVPDGGVDRGALEVVLLLESPHTHEVCYRYPLAGSAGVHVRDVLGKSVGRLFPNEPIGRSVHDGYHDFLRLGIMNVSQLPFQSDAYDCTIPQENDCRRETEWNDYIGHMNTIQDNPNACDRRIQKCKDLEDELVKDLRARLDCLRAASPNVLLVCCGGLAQTFYKKATDRLPDVCDLPHPSRDGWRKLNDCEQKCLKDIVDRLWAVQPGV